MLHFLSVISASAWSMESMRYYILAIGISCILGFMAGFLTGNYKK